MKPHSIRIPEDCWKGLKALGDAQKPALSRGQMIAKLFFDHCANGMPAGLEEIKDVQVSDNINTAVRKAGVNVDELL